MILKWLLAINVILSGSWWSYGQKKDTSLCKGELQFEVNASVKGHQYESALDENIFKKDFDLALSDSSYTIIGFSMSWTDQQSIYVSRINGSGVILTEQKYPLNIATGDFIAFDCITIKKGSEVYRAPSFVINTATAGRAEQLRKDLAPCLAYISGYKNKDIAPYTLFSSDLALQLSDSSYKIVDFVVTWDGENDSSSSASFTGNRILVKRDARTDLSRELKPGSTVTIDKIRVEKDGRIYKVKSLVMYLK